MHWQKLFLIILWSFNLIYFFFRFKVSNVAHRAHKLLADFLQTVLLLSLLLLLSSLLLLLS